ncbi:alpha/beta fold hydrolase [Rhodohalobacter mucosus]|uniref:Alpha/beta hydrolase n=1 Tax=Rhodohalobacter mucosus TaxID=2079485 RepID=A0A316TUQ6_9BACT|nr:alpha/beta fold hydrolase [Rhodohalobacter mucosus]PWN08180.1 alpha/beta hydrolase [Rhodohalobacter mucosus]
MKKETFTTKSQGYKILHCTQWVPDSPPAGVILILHGLTEHSGRYSHVARFFTGHGYLVCAYDHRGHGMTDPDHHGFIDASASSQFDLLAEDAIHVFTLLNNRYPDLPLFVLGHSMGSFLAQRMMQLLPEDSTELPAGLIYSGSSGKPPLTLYAGKFLSKWIMKRKGPAYRSQLIHNLVFGRFNKPFEPARTEFDWLSRDKDMVQLFVDDPACGFVPSVSFYHHFFSGLLKLHSHRPFAGASVHTPILVIGGDRDPVSDMGKGVKALKKLLTRSGNEDRVDLMIYQGARHEPLNEINRDEVFTDIHNWIGQVSS